MENIENSKFALLYTVIPPLKKQAFRTWLKKQTRNQQNGTLVKAFDTIDTALTKKQTTAALPNLKQRLSDLNKALEDFLLMERCLRDDSERFLRLAEIYLENNAMLPMRALFKKHGDTKLSYDGKVKYWEYKQGVSISDNNHENHDEVMVQAQILKLVYSALLFSVSRGDYVVLPAIQSYFDNLEAYPFLRDDKVIIFLKKLASINEMPYELKKLWEEFQEAFEQSSEDPQNIWRTLYNKQNEQLRVAFSYENVELIYKMLYYSLGKGLLLLAGQLEASYYYTTVRYYILLYTYQHLDLTEDKEIENLLNRIEKFPIIPTGKVCHFITLTKAYVDWGKRSYSSGLIKKLSKYNWATPDAKLYRYNAEARVLCIKMLYEKERVNCSLGTRQQLQKVIKQIKRSPLSKKLPLYLGRELGI